ncbi:hypothetical protein B296_00025290 [Ensete ventricosum]|uniref:Uncharacterized protein n=1 Tax=Ensete ventricosum TaxID=4639 RepID=A0A426ZL28_ENSVE|nr:hypothetical protein B296_00025290 [Ensete ventricosum]
MVEICWCVGKLSRIISLSRAPKRTSTDRAHASRGPFPGPRRSRAADHGPSASAAGRGRCRGARGESLLKALREVKNEFIGNKAKKPGPLRGERPRRHCRHRAGGRLHPFPFG